MVDRTREYLVEFLRSQVDLCLAGLKRRDDETALVGAEVHSAVLGLVENEQFKALFNERWQRLHAEDNNQPWIEKPLDFAPDLCDCFLHALTQFMKQGGVGGP